MRSIGMLTALGLVVTAGCVAPTDAGDRFVVQVAPVGELMEGDSTQIVATLVGPVDAGVVNTRFLYASDDPTVVLVRPDGRLLAANPGTTTVTVTSTTAAQARAAELRVTVRPAVYIDSVRPAAARYGSDLTVYGRGLDPAGGALVATVDGVPLPVVAYVPADSADPARRGALLIRLAPPLRNDPAGDGTANFAISGPRGIATADLPLRVIEKDIFEANELAPAALGVVTARREWVGLALEAADTLVPADWYTFTTTSPGDWTVKLRWGPSPEEFASLVGIPGTADVGAFPNPSFFGPSDLIYYTNGASTTGAMALCQGAGIWREDIFGGPSFPSSIGGSGYGLKGPATTTMIFRGLAAGTHHFLVLRRSGGVLRVYDPAVPGSDQFAFIGSDQWGQKIFPVRYDMSIEPGNLSDLPPDRHEPNDVCESAADFLTLGATAIADSVVSLSVDSRGDNDWLRVVTTQTGTLVLDQKENGPPGSLFMMLMNEVAPTDTTRVFASSYTNSGLGYTRPTGWDGSLTTCVPNDAAGFNFVCGAGRGLTSAIQLPAGRYRLHVGAADAVSYSLRIRWTP